MARSFAAATGHPRATDAALKVLDRGGSAVDAAIAAQAVICVVMPDAAGLGGDVLALSRTADGLVTGINGTGRSPSRLGPTTPGAPEHPPGLSVTVPGIVAGWMDLHARAGRLDLDIVLADAIGYATRGILVSDSLERSLHEQRPRLDAVCPDSPLRGLRSGDRWVQPELAAALASISRGGRDAFYTGRLAEATVAAVARSGGCLSVEDLGCHATEVADPITVAWDGGTVSVQPPHSQGVLLAMGLAWLDADPARWGAGNLSHVLVELTEAVFAHRDDCAAGPALLDRGLVVDTARAGRLGGPRPYLHTAGVSVSTSDGDMVSSLVSVFDDFGSCVWVPEGGFLMNNRADGFTAGANAAAPGIRPIHTLAPAIVTDRHGHATAMSTPGADGQVQTLLQVLCAARRGVPLGVAIDAPRWRSHDSRLVIEPDHPDLASLREAGHELVLQPRGHSLFGSVTAAGTDTAGAHASADWRRDSSARTHPERNPS